MASIDDIIKRELNPFDPISFKRGNFWLEKQDSTLNVDSIHQEVITEIEDFLDLVTKDHHSRTLLLTGDSGSGKSYLLGRLKRNLNTKAFFAYIEPWPDSEYIWRHTLRYTVDSLMYVPEGQKESQLMLWLKNLAAFKRLRVQELIFNEDIWNLLRNDQQKFVKKLEDTYKQPGIYNAKSFFGVLYCLTNPDLYPLACQWLRGDELDEESLNLLKVKNYIDSENAAKNILANFGKISTETQPIVLCFDNIDGIPKLSDGFLDIHPLFHVNTTIHNGCLKNFLIIISMPTSTWRDNSDRIQQADKAGIHKTINLKRINLSQAEALWAYRLKLLHNQASPQPSSRIYPLDVEKLRNTFPGGKTNPRNALELARKLFEEYKLNSISEPHQGKNTDSKDTEIAVFKLIWQDEYNKVKAKVKKISLISSPELIRMLQQALFAFEVKDIKLKLLKGNSSLYSFSYIHAEKRERVGVVWTEDPDKKRFFNVMTACRKAIDENLCQTLYLIRIVDVGDAKLSGFKIYSSIFTGSHHRHIKPSLDSVHYLAAYHNLVNAALANELVVAGKTISLKELEKLTRESQVLHRCTLLQSLGIIESGEPEIVDLKEVKEYLLNLVKTQNLLGKTTLAENAIKTFPNVSKFQLEQLIKELCITKQIQIINPRETADKQLICLLINSKS